MLKFIKNMFCKQAAEHDVQLIVLRRHDCDYKTMYAKAKLLKKTLKLKPEIHVLGFHFLDRITVNYPHDIHEKGLSGFDPITKINERQDQLMNLIDNVWSNTEHVILVNPGTCQLVHEHCEFIRKKMIAAGLHVMVITGDGKERHCSWKGVDSLTYSFYDIEKVFHSWLNR